jgi:hypothetical protein
MGICRLRFVDDDLILGQFDFQAGDDVEAVETAEILFHACSDRCRFWEIWEGEMFLVGGPQDIGVPMQASDLAERRQEQIIEYEEAILLSKWAIASSERLLEELNKLKANQSGPSRYSSFC